MSWSATALAATSPVAVDEEFVPEGGLVEDDADEVDTGDLLADLEAMDDMHEREAIGEPVVAMTMPEGPDLPDAINGSFSVQSDIHIDESLSPGNGRAMMATGVALSGLGFAGQMIGLKVVHDRCDVSQELTRLGQVPDTYHLNNNAGC